MSCTRSSKFLDDNGVAIKETVSASKKLGRKEATALAKGASKVIVSKGKRVAEFAPAGKPTKELLDAMLGTTGNLRAPTIKRGKTILVGYNEEVFTTILG